MMISENDWNDLSEYRDSLEHYGVKGQKWGVRKERKKTGRKRRPFTEEAKKRRANRAKTRVERAKARAEKRAQQEKVKAEKKRKKILENPTLLYKNRKQFTADEIQEAMKRFEWEKKLGDYSKDRLKNGADYIKTIFDYSNNMINLYNTAARVANSIDEDSKLPIIKTTKEIEETKKKKQNPSGQTVKV